MNMQDDFIDIEPMDDEIGEGVQRDPRQMMFLAIAGVLVVLGCCLIAVSVSLSQGWLDSVLGGGIGADPAPMRQK